MQPLPDEPAEQPLYVTQPYLPPIREFLPYVERIWESKWLTNGGPFHAELEARLCEHLDVEHLSLFSNGTIALITALQALRVTGEVITTPYSFVATTHALHWNAITPVFVDIDSRTLNLDPLKVEAAITPRTTAIMPVHVYGVPCDVGALETMANRYGLRVIYDAAHAFGVRASSRSIASAGDLSVLSFHATKAFNTFEGGAIVCKDRAMKQRIDLLKNFGFEDETTVVAPGINGKMNELQAAFGLVHLRHMGEILAKRRAVYDRYADALERVPGIRFGVALPDATDWNYSYCPIFVEHNFAMSRDGLYERLKTRGIHSRRYFYPLISQFPPYRALASATAANLPVATRIARQVLCLPIFPDLDERRQNDVISVIVEASR